MKNRIVHVCRFVRFYSYGTFTVYCALYTSGRYRRWYFPNLVYDDRFYPWFTDRTIFDHLTDLPSTVSEFIRTHSVSYYNREPFKAYTIWG